MIVHDWINEFAKRYGDLREDIEEIMLEYAYNYPDAIKGRPIDGGLPKFTEPGGVWAHLDFRGIDLIDAIEFELWYTFSWAPSDFHVIHFEEWEACSSEVEDKSLLFGNDG